MTSLQTFWHESDELLRGIALGLLALVLFWLVSSLLHRKIIPAVIKRIDNQKHPILSQLASGFHTPATTLLKVLGICVGLLVFVDQMQGVEAGAAMAKFLRATSPVAYRTIRISIVLAIAWGLVSSSDISSLLLRNARHKLDIHMSKGVSRFLAAVFNVVVVAIAVVVIMSEFNYDINGLVAGLGLGGLTIALAAKDSAANFFGGLVLVVEKPFEIGDWIVCQDVEGSVEDINLRSTKIRTAAGSLTIVPNATLSGAPITNWGGGMERRRADIILSLVYGTEHKNLKTYTEAVQTMLETDPDVASDSIIVRFSDITVSSLDVRIIFYTSMPGFADHLRVRERINYALLDLAGRNAIEFAYPTQTVYLSPEK